jgi:hypothetical protein
MHRTVDFDLKPYPKVLLACRAQLHHHNATDRADRMMQSGILGRLRLLGKEPFFNSG